jgi:hypothetical protein
LRKIGDQNQDLFVNSLFKQGVISEPIFAMEIGGLGDKSWIEFGGYDNSTTINWIQMQANQYHWTVPMPQVMLNFIEMPMTATKAILDSGTSISYLPA